MEQQEVYNAGMVLPKHIKLITAETHSPEWYEHRRSFIGASEVGTVMGINKWETRARLWQVKSGQAEGRIADNEPMYWGRMMEDRIALSWEYYDVETGEYIVNAGNGNKVRHAIVPGGFLVNDKYPWLSAAFDRIIPKGSLTLIGGKTKTMCPLEIKTIDHYAHNVNETGLPPYYEAQIMQQMIVIEAEYAEFAYLVGGQKLKVEPRQFHQGFADSILEETYDFWYNMVLPAKEIAQEIVAKPSLTKHLSKKLIALEPEPEPTNAYINWLKDNYKEEVETAKATEELTAHIIGYAKVDSLIKKLSEIADGHKSHILKFHKDMGAGRVDFGEAGKSTYKSKFVVSPAKSVYPDKEYVESIIKNI
jgi:putative phage-type endonuclease